MIVQLLKTNVTDFDFTISQARFTNIISANFNNSSTVLTYDDESFENKILIPVSYSPGKAHNSLVRLPHWEKKGYVLPEITYLSLLNAIKPFTKSS